MLNTTPLTPARVAIVDPATGGVNRPWYMFFQTFYNYFLNLPYGSFYTTTDQTAAANTPTAITFSASANTRQTSIGTPASRVVFSAGGLTTVTFSIQFTNPSTSEDAVYVWLRKNGVNVPNTASTVTVPKKHGSIDGATILTVNFHETYNPGEYLELYWLTSLGTSSIQTVPATTSPLKPASPGVVLTVSQII
jgi:hypothetical protein